MAGKTRKIKGVIEEENTLETRKEDVSNYTKDIELKTQEPKIDISETEISNLKEKIVEGNLSQLEDSIELEPYDRVTEKRPIIEVKNLIKLYGNFLAVDSLNFFVRKGEIFGILGPNGAGKTTTMEIMETVIKKTSGDVMIDGLDVDVYPHEIKKRIGVQLQSNGFFPELTLIELIELYADIYNVDIDPIKVLNSINLVEKSKNTIDQLSKGQQQRFSLAVSIISNPKIVFLDEPTTGLDPQARRVIWNLIKELKAQGTTIVLTTHYMEEAEFLCDRVAIMDSGKILEINTVKGFIEKLLFKGFKREVNKYSATLEDVFIDLTGKNLRD
ncbi:MAG: ABC transporter ATP-binding protein [Patescibacteria group bacterium]